jgi:two-component system, response regulator
MMTNEKYVLLVEDNPDDVKLTMIAFKRAQIAASLVVVSDGVEALEFVFCSDRYADRNLNDKPTFILLDLKLPFVNGIQVLEQIRADIKTKDIPVIVLTSSLETQDQDACNRLGVSGYLQKPNNLTDFVDALRHFKAQWLD